MDRPSFALFLKEHPEQRKNIHSKTIGGRLELVINLEGAKALAAWAEEKQAISPDDKSEFLNWLRKLGQRST
jgi:hypothetical protein